MPKCLFMLLLATVTGYAQQVDEAPVRKSAIYLGIQANELIRQLLNLGGSTSTVVNPYLLTFAVNSSRTGVGLNVGLGYNYNLSNTGDAITPRQTTIHNLSFRVGIEKKFMIGRKWLSSYGMDIILEDNGNLTETNFSGGIGVQTRTETTTNGIGLGPRFTLNFLITDKIIVGTEASYYYKSLSTTQKATGFSDNNTSAKSFSLSVPAVIFLILKF